MTGCLLTHSSQLQSVVYHMPAFSQWFQIAVCQLSVSFLLHLINTKKNFFSFLAAGFCVKNLAFAQKIMVCPTQGGCSPPSPLGSYAYATSIINECIG